MSHVLQEAHLVINARVGQDLPNFGTAVVLEMALTLSATNVGAQMVSAKSLGRVQRPHVRGTLQSGKSLTLALEVWRCLAHRWSIEKQRIGLVEWW